MIDVYDPRKENVRAQQQAIYESYVRRLLGAPSATPFRDKRGVRLDVQHQLIEPGLIKRTMFQIGQGVARKAGGADIEKSVERYTDVDSLIRNRQDYEETLAMARKGGWFRVVPEMTSYDVGYFVWPLAGAQKYPVGFETLKEAKADAARKEKTLNPLKNHFKWWQSPKKKYRVRDLVHWLPPADAFTRWNQYIGA